MKINKYMKYKTNLIVFVVNLFTFILFFVSKINHVSSRMMSYIIVFQSLLYINLNYFIILLSNNKNNEDKFNEALFLN